MDENKLEELSHLLEEVTDDNAQIIGALQRVQEAHSGLRTDMIREFNTLREDFRENLTYRTLKDLCTELIMPLSAIEAMLEQGDFSNPDIIRDHVNSLAITLNNVLERMGATKIPIAPGEDRFDPNRHLCVRLVTPDESPFPGAEPKTVVRVRQHGFMLYSKVLVPAQVEIQTERRQPAASRLTSPINLNYLTSLMHLN